MKLRELTFGLFVPVVALAIALVVAMIIFYNSPSRRDMKELSDKFEALYGGPVQVIVQVRTETLRVSQAVYAREAASYDANREVPDISEHVERGTLPTPPSGGWSPTERAPRPSAEQSSRSRSESEAARGGAVLLMYDHNRPWYITYQGRVLDTLGRPVSGKQRMSFSLYSQLVGGRPVWSDSGQIEVSKGVFDVSLPAGYDYEHPSLEGGLWLELTVNGYTLNPRTTVMPRRPNEYIPGYMEATP